MASNVSAISCASKRREPLKRRCSMKCETPARSSRSSREPTSIQKPRATERTLATRSEMTRSPVSSSLSTTFCTVLLRCRLSRHLRSFPCSVEPAHGRDGRRTETRGLGACDEAENRAVPLRVIQGFVGEAEERLRVARVLGARSAPEARAEVGGPRLSASGELLEQCLDARHDLPRIVLARLRQEHGELVATDAERVVRLPQ